MNGTVTRWKQVVGDTASIQIQLNGLDTILPGATVTAHVVRNGTSAAIPAAVTSEANRIVTLTLTSWLSSATPGTYKLRIILNNLTWPEQGEAEILVEASSAPVIP